MQPQQANHLPFKKTTVLSSCRLTCHELQSQTLRSCNDLLLTQESEISPKISFPQHKEKSYHQARHDCRCAVWRKVDFFHRTSLFFGVHSDSVASEANVGSIPVDGETGGSHLSKLQVCWRWNCCKKSRQAHGYFKKRQLDRTAFSPEPETGLGQQSGVPCANPGIKHPGKGTCCSGGDSQIYRNTFQQK